MDIYYKNKETAWYWYIIVTVLIYGTAFFAISRIAFAQSPDCSTGWIAKVNSPPFSYNGGEVIYKVAIRTEAECFVTNRVGVVGNGCYWVFGIDTGKRVYAAPVNDPSPDCKDISHVEFYSNGDIAPTSAPTATLSFKFWTFTPPPSQSPTPEITRTPTETVTGTPTWVSPTPTDTQSPPRKRRTPTPQTFLPNTGEFGVDDKGGIVFPVSFVALIVIIFLVRAVIRSKGGR